MDLNHLNLNWNEVCHIVILTLQKTEQKRGCVLGHVSLNTNV